MVLEAYGGGKNLFDVDPLRGVVAGVAGRAVARFAFVADGSQQAIQRKIRERIGLDKLANPLDRAIGGYQFAL